MIPNGNRYGLYIYNLKEPAMNQEQGEGGRKQTPKKKKKKKKKEKKLIA